MSEWLQTAINCRSATKDVENPDRPFLKEIISNFLLAVINGAYLLGSLKYFVTGSNLSRIWHLRILSVAMYSVRRRVAMGDISIQSLVALGFD
jgi:hypothetical protein